MSKNVKFILLQASVVFNQQIFMFAEDYPDTKEGRNAAFRNAIDKVKTKKTVKISPRITEYVLVYKATITEDIVYCQLAKKTQMDTYKLTENTIKQELIDSYPPLDVFINLKLQLFAIELNTKLLTVPTIVNTIKNLINYLVKEYSIFFNTIENKKEFWDLFSEKDSIKEISFDMVVPNFFGASRAAKDLVEGAKNKLNADSVELSIKNQKGDLKVTLDAIDSFVQYSSFAGSWKLKYKAAGETRYKTIHSADYCVKKEIESNILEIVRKMEDNNMQVTQDVFQGLVENLNGLFENEE